MDRSLSFLLDTIHIFNNEKSKSLKYLVDQLLSYPVELEPYYVEW